MNKYAIMIIAKLMQNNGCTSRQLSQGGRALVYDRLISEVHAVSGSLDKTMTLVAKNRLVVF